MKYKDIKQVTREASWCCVYTLTSLVKFITDLENGIDTTSPLQMNPDFQRGHVWTESQQISFIENLLRGGAKQARVIYLNNPSWNRLKNNLYDDMVCVDGLQRYTAIKRFVNNEIKAFGYYIDEFEDSEILKRTHLMKVSINDLQTKKEVLQWYLETNDGGTPHTREELNRVRDMLENESK